jgi:hypothetical protein
LGFFKSKLKGVNKNFVTVKIVILKGEDDEIGIDGTQEIQLKSEGKVIRVHLK